MLDKINIDYDNVLSVASNIHKLYEKLDVEVKKIEGTINKTKLVWQGSDADAYIDRLNKCVLNLNKLTNKIDEYANYLNEVLNSYYKLEDDYASKKIEF